MPRPAISQSDRSGGGSLTLGRLNVPSCPILSVCSDFFPLSGSRAKTIIKAVAEAYYANLRLLCICHHFKLCLKWRKD